MTDPEPAKSEILWRITSITALIDATLLILIARGVSYELFYKLKYKSVHDLIPEEADRVPHQHARQSGYRLGK